MSPTYSTDYRRFFVWRLGFVLARPTKPTTKCYNTDMKIGQFKVERPWALWRQVQYFTGIIALLIFVGVVGYFKWLYAPPTCYDNKQNDTEIGVDCGGACQKICLFQINPPEVLWSRAFEIAPGQYNAVAYVANKNEDSAAPQVTYAMRLYDTAGLIIERLGTTALPSYSIYPIFEGRILTGERRPVQAELVLLETEPWLPAESGREQFTVESRTLKGVDETPRLTATIVNNALTKAEEVEVVATIFDAKGEALTASRTIVPSFPPQSGTEVTFTWPRPIAKTVRSCEVPTDVILAIDLSGSMNDDGKNPPEPITSVIKAAENFTSRLRDNDRVGAVTFATRAELVSDLTDARDQVAALVANLKIKLAEETGFTNTGAAFKRVSEEFRSGRHNLDARKVAVLLTDGLATAPEDDPDGYAKAEAKRLKNEGVQVFTIGLGERVNNDFLKTLASVEEQHYEALSRSDIDRIYRLITAAICEDGPAVIDIIPKPFAPTSKQAPGTFNRPN